MTTLKQLVSWDTGQSLLLLRTLSFPFLCYYLKHYSLHPFCDVVVVILDGSVASGAYLWTDQLVLVVYLLAVLEIIQQSVRTGSDNREIHIAATQYSCCCWYPVLPTERAASLLQCSRVLSDYHYFGYWAQSSRWFDVHVLLLMWAVVTWPLPLGSSRWTTGHLTTLSLSLHRLCMENVSIYIIFSFGCFISCILHMCFLLTCIAMLKQI